MAPRPLQFISCATVFGSLVVAGCQSSPTSLIQSTERDARQREEAAAVASAFVQARNSAPQLNAFRSDITRHRVVRVDNTAANRLFQLAKSGRRSLGEKFRLAVFPDTTCTFSSAEGFTVAEDSVELESFCLENERWLAVATFNTANQSYKFRFRDGCANDSPSYEISNLEGTDYAIAYETRFTAFLRVITC